MRTCTVEGCTKAHRAKGLCGTHYNQANYSPEKRHPKIAQPCHVCGVAIVKHRASSGRRVVCSYACRYVLTFGRPKPSQDVVGPMPASCALPKPATPTVPAVRFLGVRCDWCSAHFVHDLRVTGADVRYCSTTCGKRAAKVRTRLARGRFDIDRPTRLAIYERDQWTCQLCDAPVDPDLPPSDKWAATLDHIECQSWALIPDHSPNNLRLAHRLCNSLRGDRAYHHAS